MRDFTPFAEHWIRPATVSAEPSVPGVPSRFVVAPGARARHGALLERLAPALTAGDPLADAVVAAYGEGRSATLHADLARVLATGALPRGAPAALGPFADACFAVPRWVNWEQINRGADVMARSGVYGLLVLMNAALPLAYTSPAGVKPLVRTGDLLRMTARRLVETLRFVRDTAEPDALKPGGRAWLITPRVRLIHASVRRGLARARDWDHAAWGLPINQYDMLGTSLAFSVSFLAGMRRLGFAYTDEEANAVVALWRLSGHWTGVDRALLPETEAAGRQRAAAILSTQAPPDADSERLVRALMSLPLFPWLPVTVPELTRFYYAVSRGLIGDVYADWLGFPDVDPTLALRVYHARAAMFEARRATAPGGERLAVALGRRSWNVALTLGLGGRPAEFLIPLGRQAVRAEPGAPTRAQVSQRAARRDVLA